MPEGDTVYLAAKRMAAALSGQRLTRGELRHPRLAEHDLSGLTVLGVHSVGKHLFTRFDDGRSLHTHFLMDGSWHLYRPGQRWRRPGHQARAVLTTQERVAVGFLLHGMALLATPDEHRLVGHLGPDLLNPDWDEEPATIAAQRLREHPDVEIGIALLDQRIMAGVGNLYKTEMCFLLGVAPWVPMREVDPDAVVALARRLLVLNADRPEQSTTGELTRDKQHWVYERDGKPCRRCGTRVIHAVQGNGIHARHTYYCPRCQPGPHPPQATPRLPTP
ncbi:MAG: DNA-formamidopyrimidine glycosylase family protein [Pseudonocardiaceae bacterium]